MYVCVCTSVTRSFFLSYHLCLYTHLSYLSCFLSLSLSLALLFLNLFLREFTFTQMPPYKNLYFIFWAHFSPQLSFLIVFRPISNPLPILPRS